MTQPLDDKTRIEREAEEYYQSSTTHLTTYHRSGYISGATKERERAQELVEALEDIDEELMKLRIKNNPVTEKDLYDVQAIIHKSIDNYTKDARDHSE